MSTAVALATWLTTAIAVSAMAQTPTGSYAALLSAALLAPLPALVLASPILKVVFAFLVIVLFVSATDFAFGPRPGTFLGRLAHVFGTLFFVDSTQIKTLPTHLDRLGAAQAVCALLAVGAVVALWPHTEALGTVARYIVRSLLSAVVVLALAELTTGLVRLVSAASGASLPPVHDAPYLSRTLNEFWTRRWNLATGSWLRRHCFSPLKRRGAVLALTGTFMASAVLHAYLFITVDLIVALTWAAFFLAQPPLLLVERRLRVRFWPLGLARIWTIAVLVSLLPLLLSPFLSIFKTSL